ncbi:MAG: Spy/CpxP family protein refolding chaperone [Myxococcales bacterium]|nr:Spy/CpxP family protein refolding chaperone [Myxococcales bacterium]MDH5566138.1 Spy/CpxP family protein refolding chaperone [Myxococcales bacterium]
MRRILVLLAVGTLLLASPSQAQEDTAPEAAGGAVQRQQPPPRAGAGGARSHAQRAENFRGRLLQDIELSADQSAHMDEIVAAHVKSLETQQQKMNELREQMREARQAGDAERVRKHADELRELRKESPDQFRWISEMRLVLTPDQQKQFDENRDRMRQGSKNRGGARRAPQAGS